MNDKCPHHWTIRVNHQIIKKCGKDKWLKAQEKEWSYKSCGARIIWYQKKCKCRHALDAWEVPDY